MNVRTSSARLTGPRIFVPMLALSMVMAAAGCTSPSSTVDDLSASSRSVSSSSVSSPSPSDGVQSTQSKGSESSGSGEPATSAASADDTASVSIPPAVTTPVPAPGGGDISQTIPAVDMTTQGPVALDEPGDFGRGVTIALGKAEKITTEAKLPGEIAGPGLALTFTITNDSDAAIDVSSVVVDVADAAGIPAIGMTAAPSAPFTGDVAAGTRATGVYVITLPAGSTDPISISVTYSSQAPIVVFTGAPS